MAMTKDTLDLTRIVAAVENVDPPPLHKVLSVLRNIDIAKYTVYASLILLVYDWFLTLDEEVFLVWPSRFGVAKVLFFLNRYFPFVDLVVLVYVYAAGSDASACVKAFRAAGGTLAFSFLVAQLILAMRTWAIWARRSTVTVLLAMLILTTTGVDVYVLYRYLSGVSYFSLGTFSTNYQGCPLQFANRFIFVDYVLVMVTETVMLTLLVVKALELFKHSRSTLMVRMFKDGVIYFLFILITSIANLVVILAAPMELHNFLIITQRILHSIFCSRVLLHIRGAYTNAGLYSSTDPSDSQHAAGDAHYGFRRPFSVSQGGGYNHGISISRANRARTAKETFELTSFNIRDRDSVADCDATGTGYNGWGMGYGYDGQGVTPSSRSRPTAALTKTESERAWDKEPSPRAVSSTFSHASEIPWSNRTPRFKTHRGL